MSEEQQREQELWHGRVLMISTPLGGGRMVADAHRRPLRVGDIVRIRSMEPSIVTTGKVLRLSAVQVMSPRVDVRFGDGEIHFWWADDLVIERSAEDGPTPDFDPYNL